MTPLDPDVERELSHLDKRVLAVEHTPLRLMSIEVELNGIKEDLTELRRAFEDRGKERKRERESADRERKSDRRWMIGSVFTTGSFVTGALALIVNAGAG